MIRTNTITYLAAVLLMLSGTVVATAQKRFSLDECIRIAEQNNPAIRSARLSVEQARTMEGTAFDIDRTGISLSQDLTGGGSPENAIVVSQTFAFPTVYGAKHKLLKEQTALQEKQAGMTAWELKRDVSSEYCDLLYTIERQRILTRQADIYKRFLFLANAKLKYGETGKLEQMNAARLCRENEIALQNVARDVLTARTRLAQLLCSADSIMPAEDSLTVIGGQTVGLLQDNPGTMLLKEVLAQQQRVAGQSVKVEQQQFLPDITVGASTQLVLKGLNPYNVDRSRFDKGNFMGFEVGVSVPLFFGAQKARLKAARKESERLNAEAETRLLQLRNRYDNAMNDLRKAEANLEYYDKEGMKEADELERISQVSYEKGSIGYVEYIQNLQTAVDIRNARATAVNEVNQAKIRLRYL